MMESILGDLPGSAQHIGGLLVGVLAVLGGAAVGGFGLGLLVQLLNRFVSRNPVPRPLLRVVRLLGAIALGWLVALVVFGSGGFGLGGPGGFGFGGSGAGTGEAAPQSTAPASTSPQEKPTTTAHAETSARPVSLRVEVLGEPGDRAARFYRLEGETRRMSLAELREVLRQRQQQDPPLQRLILVIYENSPARDHPAVRDVERWAKEHDLQVTLDFPRGNAP